MNGCICKIDVLYVKYFQKIQTKFENKCSPMMFERIMPLEIWKKKNRKLVVSALKLLKWCIKIVDISYKVFFLKKKIQVKSDFDFRSMTFIRVSSLEFACKRKFSGNYSAIKQMLF